MCGLNFNSDINYHYSVLSKQKTVLRAKYYVIKLSPITIMQIKFVVWIAYNAHLKEIYDVLKSILDPTQSPTYINSDVKVDNVLLGIENVYRKYSS